MYQKFKKFNGKKYRYGWHLKTKKALKTKKEWYKQYYPKYSLRSVKVKTGYLLYIEVKKKKRGN